MKKWYMAWMSGNVAVIPVLLLAGGVVMVITGYSVFHHNQQLADACQSTLGQVAQGLGVGNQQCSTASHLETVGSVLFLVGLAGGIVGTKSLTNSRAIVRARELAGGSEEWS